MMRQLILLLIFIIISPLLYAIISRTKAFLVGKKGIPFLFNYYTLIKLFRKNVIYSKTITPIFKVAPIINLSAILLVLMFLPLGNLSPLLSFKGDVLFIFYLLTLGKIFMVLAGVDTGSSFEGMGCAREVFFSALGEIVLFLIFIMFYRLTNQLELSSYFVEGKLILHSKATLIPIIFISIALFVILLLENARVPVDDPLTHLELTMIHEVMILDYSGPDLGIIHLTSQLKMFFYAALISNLLMPVTSVMSIVPIIPVMPVTSGMFSVDVILPFSQLIVFTAILISVYVIVGVVESSMGRYQLKRVPKFVLSSLVLVVLATILTWRG
ncbi:MAG: NADH-quinone oxidoreductase subunit H [Oligoflexia bacterium]|nr:NADH-quinone oxidoreductase subunit H [Oligoflexia bacterium]